MKKEREKKEINGNTGREIKRMCGFIMEILTFFPLSDRECPELYDLFFFYFFLLCVRGVARRV